MPIEILTRQETRELFLATLDNPRNNFRASEAFYCSGSRVADHARDLGSHFFDRDTMRYFGSRLMPDAYQINVVGNVHLDGREPEAPYNACEVARLFLFRTSEAGAPMTGDPRMHTVRYAVEILSPDERWQNGRDSRNKYDALWWSMGDVGGFRTYETSAQTRRAVERIVKRQLRGEDVVAMVRAVLADGGCADDVWADVVAR